MESAVGSLLKSYSPTTTTIWGIKGQHSLNSRWERKEEAVKCEIDILAQSWGQNEESFEAPATAATCRRRLFGGKDGAEWTFAFNVHVFDSTKESNSTSLQFAFNGEYFFINSSGSLLPSLSGWYHHLLIKILMW